MKQQITKINWMLNSFCKADCFYCPGKYKNGPEPRDISEYKQAILKLITHYNSLGRNIYWNFNGGEPLDMFDFTEILKICKENNGKIELTTNGGKLWLDWWAIEPHVDILHLTFHYWQNFNLIKYIIQTFQKNNKNIDLIIPLRPKEHFNTDWEKACEIEQEFNMVVKKLPLNKVDNFEYLDYTEDQFEKMFGKDWVDENIKKTKTIAQQFQQILDSNPSYTDKLCNVGIEFLTIEAEGWVRGSICNNLHLGNIWKEDFFLPTQPSKCKMLSCIHTEDQKITKFT